MPTSCSILPHLLYKWMAYLYIKLNSLKLDSRLTKSNYLIGPQIALISTQLKLFGR